MFFINLKTEIVASILSFRKSRHKPNLESTSKYGFSPDLGGGGGGGFGGVLSMQRTANENAARKRRICKRSDQPKIDRIAKNDARLILREKLNGATT